MVYHTRNLKCQIFFQHHYKNCLLNGEVILKSQQRFISKGHDIYAENINKIALTSNDDKRIVSSDKITSYPYGYKVKNALIQ